jgi:hypothetical protein
MSSVYPQSAILPSSSRSIEISRPRRSRYQQGRFVSVVVVPEYTDNRPDYIPVPKELKGSFLGCLQAVEMPRFLTIGRDGLGLRYV